MFITTWLGCATVFAQQQDTTRLDTTRSKVINPYLPSFQPRDRYGDPFSNTSTYSPFFLKDPKSLSLDVEIDSGMNYNIREKIGDVNFRPNSSMSFEEFNRQQERTILKGYWQGRSKALDGESAVSGRNLLPKIYVSPTLDRIFGNKLRPLTALSPSSALLRPCQ